MIKMLHDSVIHFEFERIDRSLKMSNSLTDSYVYVGRDNIHQRFISYTFEYTQSSCEFCPTMCAQGYHKIRNVHILNCYNFLIN